MPYLAIACSFRLIGAMADFDKVFMLTGGGPGDVTTTLSILNYKLGFQVFDMGKTTAAAWLFVIVVLLISAPILSLLGRTTGAER